MSSLNSFCTASTAAKVCSICLAMMSEEFVSARSFSEITRLRRLKTMRPALTTTISASVTAHMGTSLSGLKNLEGAAETAARANRADANLESNHDMTMCLAYG